MITSKDIAALRELRSQMPDSIWRSGSHAAVSSNEKGEKYKDIYIGDGLVPATIARAVEDDGHDCRATAALITAAVNNLVPLCDELEAARAAAPRTDRSPDEGQMPTTGIAALKAMATAALSDYSAGRLDLRRCARREHHLARATTGLAALAPLLDRVASGDADAVAELGDLWRAMLGRMAADEGM